MDTLYRHWIILRMIPARRKIDTTEILSRLESEHGITTTLRTIQRDLIMLETSGFPLENDGKKPAGWSWMKDAPHFDIPNMDPVTALTFKLTSQYLSRLLPHGVLSALDPYFTTADQRLKQTKESTLSRWPDKVRIISRNLTTLPPAVSPELSEAAYTALLEERRFTAEYRTLNGKISRYNEVNPLGMAFVDGLTYLIASINQHTDPVLLLLHRFQSIELLKKPVTVPENFDLDAWVQELLTFPVGDTIRLKIRFSSQSDVQRLRESPLVENQVIKELSDGKFELTASVEDTLQLRWWLNGFGARVEVLAPKALRQEYVELAQKYGDMYLSLSDV